MTTNEPPPDPRARWEANFIAQMARRRESLGLTQTDLARKIRAAGLPFHQQTIQRIEAGTRPVRLNEAYLIALALDVDLDLLASTMGDTRRDVQAAVDDLARGAEAVARRLRLEIAKWEFEYLSPLMTVCAHILPEERPTTAGVADPLLRWAFQWANRAAEVAEQLQLVYRRFAVLANMGSETEIEAVDLPVVDIVTQWRKQYPLLLEPELDPRLAPKWSDYDIEDSDG